jgi:hypothetical protein
MAEAKACMCVDAGVVRTTPRPPSRPTRASSTSWRRRSRSWRSGFEPRTGSPTMARAWRRCSASSSRSCWASSCHRSTSSAYPRSRTGPASGSPRSSRSARMRVREGTIRRAACHACASCSYSNACRYAEDDLDDDTDSGKALRAALRAWYLCMNGAGEAEGLDFLVVWRNLRELCWRKKRVGGRAPVASLVMRSWTG